MNELGYRRSPNVATSVDCDGQITSQTIQLANSAANSIPKPRANTFVTFYDSSNSGRLSKKSSTGVVTILEGSSMIQQTGTWTINTNEFTSMPFTKTILFAGSYSGTPIVAIYCDTTNGTASSNSSSVVNATNFALNGFGLTLRLITPLARPVSSLLFVAFANSNNLNTAGGHGDIRFFNNIPSIYTIATNIITNTISKATIFYATDLNGTQWNATYPLPSVTTSVSSPVLINLAGQPAIIGVSSTGITYRLATDLTFNTLVASPAAITGTGGGTVATGRGTQLLEVSGRPAVFWSQSAVAVGTFFLRADDATGSTWAGAATTVSGAVQIGDQLCSSSIINGNPAIVMYTNSRTQFHYVRATDAIGGAWAAGVNVGPVTVAMPTNTTTILFGEVQFRNGAGVIELRPMIAQSIAFLTPGTDGFALYQQIRYIIADDTTGTTWPASYTDVPLPAAFANSSLTSGTFYFDSNNLPVFIANLASRTFESPVILYYRYTAPAAAPGGNNTGPVAPASPTILFMQDPSLTPYMTTTTSCDLHSGENNDGRTVFMFRNAQSQCMYSRASNSSFSTSISGTYVSIGP